MPNKELTTETRLLLAFVLVGIVLVGWNYIYKPPPPPVTAPAQTTQPAAEAPKVAQVPPVPAEQPAPVAGQVQASQAEEFTIETDLYRVQFSNQGAVVRSWILKHYKDTQGKPLELVNTKALSRVPAPFALAFRNQAPANDPNKALFKVDRSGDLSVTFEYSDGRTATKKTFQFMPNSYLVQITSQVIDNGVLLPHELTWRGGFGDQTIPTPASVEDVAYYDEANSKLVQNALKTADKGPVSTSGQYSFAGIEDSYFAAVVLPKAAGSGLGVTTYSDLVPGPTATDEKRIGAGVGGSGVNSFNAFIGPKDSDILSAVNPKLEKLIDWGTYFGIIAKPLFLVLTWTAKHVTGENFGWAIVVVTIAINMVLFPLRFTSMKSSKKMQALQPQIQAINAKYKDLPMRDPRKQEQQAEMMELYKKNGVNPVGGCVPMLIQLPFLYGFYTVLRVAIEMRGASWLWVHDLSQPETLAIRVLPVLLVATQFMQQKMTPSPGMDPAQQKMMLFMPLVLGYIFYYLSAGLVLYYMTGGLVGVAQQWLLNRGTPAPAVIPSPPVKKKK